jgi:DNA polymerase III delta prime subunit
METLIIKDEDIATRLRDIAEQEERTVEEVLGSMLKAYTSRSAGTVEAGSLAMLARSAVEANIQSDHVVDTSTRSREILRTEFADYLKRRIDEQSDSD